MVGSKAKKLPYVPTEEEIRKYYKTVLESRNTQDMIIIRTLLYTGVRVSELIRLKISDINLDRCQMRIISGKGQKDRIVLFPKSFRETLALYTENTKKTGHLQPL